MLNHDILAPVLPEVTADRVPRLRSTIAAELSASVSPEALRRLAALLPADPAGAERIAARLRLSRRANASRSGALVTWPSSFNLAKAGLSASRARIQIEFASRMAETRNGIRQPHDRSWSCGMSAISAKVPLERTVPAGTPA